MGPRESDPPIRRLGSPAFFNEILGRGFAVDAEVSACQFMFFEDFTIGAKTSLLIDLQSGFAYSAEQPWHLHMLHFLPLARKARALWGCGYLVAIDGRAPIIRLLS